MLKYWSYIVISAGLSPHPKDKVRFAPQKEEPPTRDAPKTSQPKVSKLSFEDYHQTWCGIATSKSQYDTKNPCEFWAVCSVLFLAWEEIVKNYVPQIALNCGLHW